MIIPKSSSHRLVRTNVILFALIFLISFLFVINLSEAALETSMDAGVLVVESLLPDEGIEIDDGDDNPDTKTFIVAESDLGNITVTAVPNPNVAEPDLPVEWTLIGGSGTSKLSRIISKASCSKTVLTCTCGSSSKTTTIYVYLAYLHLYADEGTGVPKIGHSWWKFTIDQFSSELLSEFDKQLDRAGYWPTTGDKLNPSPGEVRYGNQGYAATGYHAFNISFDSLKAGLQYVDNLEDFPGTFYWLSHNCTDEACTVAASAGVSTIGTSGLTTPEALSDWLNSQ